MPYAARNLDKKRAADRASKARRRARLREMGLQPQPKSRANAWVGEQGNIRPPSAVMVAAAARRLALAECRDPNVILLGDPMPGRSALDRPGAVMTSVKPIRDRHEVQPDERDRQQFDPGHDRD